MIAYLYLKSDNRIVSIIRDVNSISNTEILGVSDYAKGVDFSLVDVFCVENELKKIVDFIEKPLENGDILITEGLINLKNIIVLQTIRTVRNNLLTDSDWTQLPDSPLSVSQREVWSIYRQQLRDFPSIVNLENVIYPSKPK